jgi:phosphoglucosamine mutase
MVETGQRASELARVFEPVPQRLVNVRFAEGKTPLKSDIVQNAVAEAEAELGSDGRLLLRASGTEPLIRVMAEAIDPGMLDRVMARLVGAVEAAS